MNAKFVYEALNVNEDYTEQELDHDFQQLGGKIDSDLFNEKIYPIWSKNGIHSIEDLKIIIDRHK